MISRLLAARHSDVLNWVCSCCCAEVPVGSFPPNRWGLYDMAGDVFEWVADCYYESYAGAPAVADIARARARGKCPMRVLRASSWFNLPSFLRSAYRFRELPSSRNTRRGFRVVRLADPHR